ncbi:MurR/RpiR family transcriptional regulator [Paenibacillus sp. 481]|uniref:MurR/RpiR family transcriptional regulator n=1 Tax=Paenibacillus sp. 481 TaxID=2835869 RepID=UPI001E3FA647|nr:MurR/RpiR family transcriptional regulator [Paenibacillus sp. 481]UHA72095.1 MurR/RpiR family transcriptional regulator [Paenibacillus sp. 481]
MKSSQANALLLMRSLYPSFSYTEKKIAKYVLAHPDKVLYATVTELAEKTETGETSVLRLCRNLGFSSYQQFKLALAKHQASVSHQVDDRLEEEQDRNEALAMLADKLASDSCTWLEHIRKQLDIGQLQRAVHAINSANQVLLIGMESTGFHSAVISEAQDQLLELGIDTIAVQELGLMTKRAAFLTSKDVLFIISSGQEHDEVLSAIQLARQKQATIIGLAANSGSEAAERVDIRLLVQADQEVHPSFQAKMMQLYVLQVLLSAIALEAKPSDPARNEIHIHN